MYSSDFLLSLRRLPHCLAKPEVLSNTLVDRENFESPILFKVRGKGDRPANRPRTWTNNKEDEREGRRDEPARKGKGEGGGKMKGKGKARGDSDNEDWTKPLDENRNSSNPSRYDYDYPDKHERRGKGKHRGATWDKDSHAVASKKVGGEGLDQFTLGDIRMYDEAVNHGMSYEEYQKQLKRGKGAGDTVKKPAEDEDDFFAQKKEEDGKSRLMKWMTSAPTAGQDLRGASTIAPDISKMKRLEDVEGSSPAVNLARGTSSNQEGKHLLNMLGSHPGQPAAPKQAAEKQTLNVNDLFAMAKNSSNLPSMPPSSVKQPFQPQPPAPQFPQPSAAAAAPQVSQPAAMAGKSYIENMRKQVEVLVKKVQSNPNDINAKMVLQQLLQQHQALSRSQQDSSQAHSSSAAFRPMGGVPNTMPQPQSHHLGHMGADREPARPSAAEAHAQALQFQQQQQRLASQKLQQQQQALMMAMAQRQSMNQQSGAMPDAHNMSAQAAQIAKQRAAYNQMLLQEQGAAKHIQPGAQQDSQASVQDRAQLQALLTRVQQSGQAPTQDQLKQIQTAAGEQCKQS